ncbi:MAG: hypothetical protein WCD18_28045 [Thermosynechococcaceae cyanobacterium]
MTSQSIRETAKSGDAAAIATILNTNLNPQFVQAEVDWQEGYLQIWLKASEVPSQNLVSMIQFWLSNLQSQVIRRVKVDGLKIDGDCSIWTDEFELIPPLLASPEGTKSPENQISLGIASVHKDEENSLASVNEDNNFVRGFAIVAIGISLLIFFWIIGGIICFLSFSFSSCNSLVSNIFFLSAIIVAPGIIVYGIITMLRMPRSRKQPNNLVRQVQSQMQHDVSTAEGSTVSDQPITAPGRNLPINPVMKYGIAIATTVLIIAFFACVSHHWTVSSYDYSNDNLGFSIRSHRNRPHPVLEFFQLLFLGCSPDENSIILRFFLIIIYIVHAIKNTTVYLIIRFFYGIGFFLIPHLFMPIYCYFFIWRDRPPAFAQKRVNTNSSNSS